MKGVDISGENLEELLAYDDLFLDYFNAFLALPVFPQALAYNRLTGGFDEVLGAGTTAISGSGEVTPPYGVTDEERERMLEWAKQERLPLFLRTQLFREFKLAKLLLRPLDDRNSASQGGSSQTVRGYSRQTESYVSSLSNSGDNSANDAGDPGSDLTWSEFPQSAFFVQGRPNSRAVSLPNQKAGKLPQLRQGELTRAEAIELSLNFHGVGGLQKSHTDLSLPVRSERSKSTGEKTGEMGREETTVSFYTSEIVEDDSDKQRGKTPGVSELPINPFYRDLSRAVSAPTNYREYLKFPSYSDFDALLGLEEPEPTGQNYVLFHDEGVSDEQTETDVKNMEGRHKMCFQQMKEQVLGTYEGMEALKEFLSNTVGIHLLNFWLDCEYFKDTMEDYDEVSNMETRNRLFRDIQDKYKMSLTREARDHLQKAARSVGLSHSVFIHTQYDVLRRLRAYWVLRLLLHLDRQTDLSSWPEQTWPGNPPALPMMPRQMSRMSIFPSISLVHSLPVQTEDMKMLTAHQTWDMVSRPGAHLRDCLKSANTKLKGRLVTHVSRPLRDGLILALTTDKAAGGPFQRFIKRQGSRLPLSMLLFWQDVTEYGAAEDRSADRLLRLNYAWTIFRKYMTQDSELNIGLSVLERETLTEKLTSAKDFIEASIFDSAKCVVVEHLEKIWLRFLKEDLKTFLDSRFGCDEDTVPPSTASVVEITETEDNQILITRPRPWIRRRKGSRYPGSTESERGRRLRSALSLAESIDEERVAEKKRLAKERRKEMERERKKAIKAARMRQKAAKSKKPASTESGDGRSRASGEGDSPDGYHSDKPVNFVDMTGNKQLLTIFKRYLQEIAQRETLNSVGLYMDIQAYTAMGGGKENKQRKDTQAAFIHKTYLDQGSKKHTPMPESIAAKLAAEKERPKTPTLKEIQSHVLPNVDESFKSFVEVQAESMGLEPQALASMSRSELAMRMESDTSMMSAFNKRKGKLGKGELGGEMSLSPSVIASRRKKKQTGRLPPSKDDKVGFLLALNQSVFGRISLQLLYFFKYLVKHGEEDGFPFIDRDLIFYLEVQKFKECSHVFADEEMLKRKVQCIVDCFLESITPPNVQIGVSAEMQQKTLKAAQRYLTGKEVTSTIFDEAQFAVFKDLLPYWAGFRRSQTPVDMTRVPTTKLQKILKKRLETIENYEMPGTRFVLPEIPSTNTATYSFTLHEGIKCRDGGLEEFAVATPIGEKGEAMSRQGRRLSVATNIEGYRKRSRTGLMTTPSTAASSAAFPRTSLAVR